MKLKLCKKNAKTEHFLETSQKVNYTFKDFLNWEDIDRNVEKFDKNGFIDDLQSLCIYDENNIENSKKIFESKFKFFWEKWHEDSLIGKLLLLLASRKLLEKPNSTFYVLNREVTFDMLRNKTGFSVSEYHNTELQENVLKLIYESKMFENIFNKRMHIYSYIKGVEAGLYSNKRKNIFGSKMVQFITKLFEGFGIKFDTEKKIENISKKFDFIVTKSNKKYLIETNFFNEVGSKINSESNRFIGLNDKVKNVNKNNETNNEKYEFVYITDGMGWNGELSSLNNVNENVENFFNINDAVDWVKKMLNDDKK